jgi:hypothetical protein
MQWLTRMTPKFRVFNSSRISGFIQPSETFYHPVQNAAKLPRVQNAILCWRALIFPKSAASRLIAPGPVLTRFQQNGVLIAGNPCRQSVRTACPVSEQAAYLMLLSCT